MPYGGTRNYKLYTWWTNGMTRSFKTEENAIAAFEALNKREKSFTDVWFEPYHGDKTFLIRQGKYAG